MGRFPEFEKAELWDRFEEGESLRAISRSLGRASLSVRTHVVAAGWRRPVPAADWCRLRLSFREREEISRGIAGGESLRCIARRLGRSPSTVSREVASNLPDGNTAEAVRFALAEMVQRLPAHLWESLTSDQGKEMAQHAQFTVDTGVQVYFCDPRRMAACPVVLMSATVFTPAFHHDNTSDSVSVLTRVGSCDDALRPQV